MKAPTRQSFLDFYAAKRLCDTKKEQGFNAWISIVTRADGEKLYLVEWRAS